jgi:hypothetical protein
MEYCVDSLSTSPTKRMLFYIRGVISKAFEVMTTYYKLVSIDFSSVLNGLKSKLSELKSMSIQSNLSSSQLKNDLLKYVITAVKTWLISVVVIKVC